MVLAISGAVNLFSVPWTTKNVRKGFALTSSLRDGFRCDLDVFQRVYPPGSKTFYKCFRAFLEVWQRFLFLWVLKNKFNLPYNVMCQPSPVVACSLRTMS